MKYNRVILVGSGWGAIAAYKGLVRGKLPIWVISEDLSLKTTKQTIPKDELSRLTNELIIFSGHKPIVKEPVISANKCINIHYSLLPAYRGLHSTVWAILNNEPQLGLTIHEMNEFIDDGPIIFQKAFDNDGISTSADYINVFNQYITDNISKIIQAYLSGEIKAKPQDKLAASWVGKRNLNDCKLDFTTKIEYLKLFFRALVDPYPKPFFEYHGRRISIEKPQFHPSTIMTHCGRILNIDNEGIWIKVSDGYLVTNRMHDESGNIVLPSHFRIGAFVNQ